MLKQKSNQPCKWRGAGNVKERMITLLKEMRSLDGRENSGWRAKERKKFYLVVYSDEQNILVDSNLSDKPAWTIKSCDWYKKVCGYEINYEKQNSEMTEGNY